MTHMSVAIWMLFAGGCLALVLLDLLVLHRGAEEIGLGDAWRSTAGFIAVGVAFGVVVAVWQGTERAGEFYAGYVLELTLSLDNVLVFALIFSAFSVPLAYQHRLLFWGVLVAFALRGAFVAAGAGLLARFEWVVYAFGLLLLVSGARVARSRHRSSDPRSGRISRLVRGILPLTRDLVGQRLLVRASRVPRALRPERPPLPGGWYATPLLAVLLTIEASDLVFALDSIPAIFGVTREPFIVFSATASAMLGVRSMYFVLAGAIRRFAYLNAGVGVVLCFVGIRFLLTGVVEINAAVTLIVILTVLAAAMGASVVAQRRALPRRLVRHRPG
jgi:tellurite resistance protein TerC